MPFAFTASSDWDSDVRVDVSVVCRVISRNQRPSHKCVIITGASSISRVMRPRRTVPSIRPLGMSPRWVTQGDESEKNVGEEGKK